MNQPFMNVASQQRVRDFIERHQPEDQPRPRLIFGLDATASRQPTWDRAAELQVELFKAAGARIDVQLVYFRGSGPVRECKTSDWVSEPAKLALLMSKIICSAGYTQIGRVLTHVQKETDRHPIRALIYVGDMFEETLDPLSEQAAALGKKNVPIFMFQEGDSKISANAFQTIAKASDGIYARFDEGSARQLAEFLRAVGAFAIDSNRAALSKARERLLLASRGGSSPWNK